ncbi:feruloyl-CoA synthase [Roseomonas sp. BN140053]|uniref:feruloyl-CoA synthase n=1 Tax=Roseomonas sp. BN140053 TaxID=3391898 RepID=UPI0039E93105
MSHAAQPRLGASEVRFEHRPDGSTLVIPVRPLGPYATRLTERLEHWARETPDAVFMGQRDATSAWRTITYAQTLDQVRALGQALLDRGLSPERPLAILSGNDLEHAVLGLAAMHVGVPYAPVSNAYSLVATDFGKLRHVLGLLTPGLVFAAEGERYARALREAVPEGTELATTTPAPGLATTRFAELLNTAPTAAVERAAAAVGPDTVAKILFTSGSTGLPKGVINTQRMLCSNQRMLQESFPFLEEEPPVIVDWLPWNHTFGGNHNIGLVLYNGGTLWIDDGKPTHAGIAESVRNLREISPTAYFNVPKGYEELIPFLQREPELRQRFFGKLKMLFFAAAGLAQHTWDALDALALDTVGHIVPMMTGLGSTETAPFALCCRHDAVGSGIVGLPVPGVELKLVPVDGKLEARVRGPNVTPGYWRAPVATADSFDEEGWYRMGDALCLLDESEPQKGYRFDGRIAEDFKLNSGTWVSVGPLRAKLIEGLAPIARDVVVAGHDRDFLSAIVIPDLGALREICGSDAEGDLGRHPRLLECLAGKLRDLLPHTSGSSTRVVRAMVLTDTLSLDAGEVTDKGSINQRAVLKHRAALVEALYAAQPEPHIASVEKHLR